MTRAAGSRTPELVVSAGTSPTRSAPVDLATAACDVAPALVVPPLIADRLTLDDLWALCDAYVPVASRHDASRGPDADAWWAAHEIGHLLTAEPSRVGMPFFGLDENAPDADEGELRCRELAAMHVARRLHHTVGRIDLVREEEEATDFTTVCWDDGGRVAAILREFRCLRLPRTRRALEERLRRIAGAARVSPAVEPR